MDGDIRGYFGYFLFSRGCFSTGLLVSYNSKFLDLITGYHALQ